MHVHIFKIKLKLVLVGSSDGLSHDELRAVSSVQTEIVCRKTSGKQWKYKKEIDQDKIWIHSRVIGTLKIWLVLLGNS